jgi:hypothetical protein
MLSVEAGGHSCTGEAVIYDGVTASFHFHDLAKNEYQGERDIMNKMISSALISGAAFGLSSLSVLAQTGPVNISGLGKIDSQNDPTPLCLFEQIGEALAERAGFIGSCEGPNGVGDFGIVMDYATIGGCVADIWKLLRWRFANWANEGL